MAATRTPNGITHEARLVTQKVLQAGFGALEPHVPVEIKRILIGVIIIANTALSQWQRRKSA